MSAFARHRSSALAEALLIAIIAAILAGVSGLTAAASAGPPAAGTPSEFREGILRVRHGDDFSSGRMSGHAYLLETAAGETELVFEGAPPDDAANGAKVRVRGAGRGRQFMVAADGTQQLAGPEATVLAAPTTKRIAVVLINFSDMRTTPYTTATAAGVAFTNTNSVAAYYAESSWGLLTLTGDVFGWYEIPDSSAGCSYSAWATSANNAAAAAGVNLSAYDHVVYGFPSVSGCGWSGLAQMPGRYSWLNGTGAMGLRVMAHELGHNFGTHHASTLSCMSGGMRVSLAASGCTASEYGDPFTVMGAASQYQHTNFSRGNFGWLQATNTQVVSAAGDYTLKPIEPFGSGVQALRVLRSSNSYLTLEYRQPSGFDNFATSAPVVNGVSVRLAPGYSTRSQSQLVDATPATTVFTDAALPVGSTLFDPVSGVSITTLSVSAAEATVRISFGGPTPTPTPTPAPTPTPTPAPTPTPSPTPSPSPTPGDLQPPSAPGTLSASVGKAKKVTLAWGASTDNVGVAGYWVYRNGTQIGTSTGLGYVDVVSGRRTTATYTIRAFDAAGNLGPASNAVSVTP